MRAPLVTIILFVSYSTLVKSNCVVDTNKKFLDPTPLFIEASLKKSFYNPTVQLSNLIFNTNDKFIIACPGPGNKIVNLNAQEAEVECDSSGKFAFKGKKYELDNLKCKNWPTSVQDTTGVCGGSFKLVKTGFKVSGIFIPVMSTCFDDKTDRTLYTNITLSKNALFQTNIPRPSFRTGNFFK